MTFSRVTFDRALNGMSDELGWAINDDILSESDTFSMGLIRRRGSSESLAKDNSEHSCRCLFSSFERLFYSERCLIVDTVFL